MDIIDEFRHIGTASSKIVKQFSKYSSYFALAVNTQEMSDTFRKCWVYSWISESIDLIVHHQTNSHNDYKNILCPRVYLNHELII